MIVKIIASKPVPGQKGIKSLIGSIVKTGPRDPDDGSVTVNGVDEFGGQIILNRGEYSIIRKDNRKLRKESK